MTWIWFHRKFLKGNSVFKSLKNCYVILQSKKADKATDLYSPIDQKQVICIFFFFKEKIKSVTRSSFLALTYKQDFHSRLKIKPENKNPKPIFSSSPAKFFLMETVLSCIL